MTPDLMVAIGTFALVLVTGVLVFVTLKGVREQLWLMTFSEYTRRYSEIMKGVPFEARRPGGGFDLSALSSEARESFLQVARNYLNLCSEELFLHRRSRVDRETWVVWRTGMRDTLQCQGFSDAWRSLRAEYDCYPDFQGFVDQLATS